MRGIFDVLAFVSTAAAIGSGAIIGMVASVSVESRGTFRW